jgi:hypothetical protein
MADGKLELTVRDVLGNPIGEPADVFLRNQTLSDAPAFRQLNVTTPVNITGLNSGPNGRYRIEVDSLSYHTVSRFISIPASGEGEVLITLPVNPKKVIRVDFPDFGALPQAARDLLGRSGNVLNFVGKKGEDLYLALDDIRRAGFLNLVAKANRTRFVAQQGDPRSVLSFFDELHELRGDRFFGIVSAELRSETVNSVHSELFHEVSEALHTPPSGFAKDRSFKTLDDAGNLQLSFFSSADGRVAVDMDIDDAQGFEHVFQVVNNFFGGPTHPYNIHEILIASQELDPGYRLVLHEEVAAQAGGGTTS